VCSIVFAALGLALAWLAWSSDADARALLAVLGVGLLFAFGRTTFGSLVEVIPGGADLFFRRFMMGVQLPALLLAGRGAAWLAVGCVRRFEARVPRWPSGLSPAAVLVAAVAVLAPACEASPPPARSARNAPTSISARPQRGCGCAVPELRCSAPLTTAGGRQP
jgi:hypothetical protein